MPRPCHSEGGGGGRMGRWINGGLRQHSLQRNLTLVDPRSKNQREWFGFGSAFTMTAQWPGRPGKPAVSPSVVRKHVVHQYPCLPCLICQPFPGPGSSLSPLYLLHASHCPHIQTVPPTLSNLYNLNLSVPSTHLKSHGTQLWRNLCLCRNF